MTNNKDTVTYVFKGMNIQHTTFVAFSDQSQKLAPKPTEPSTDAQVKQYFPIYKNTKGGNFLFKKAFNFEENYTRHKKKKKKKEKKQNTIGQSKWLYCPGTHIPVSIPTAFNFFFKLSKFASFLISSGSSK